MREFNTGSIRSVLQQQYNRLQHKKGGLHMYVQWQKMTVVETRQADKGKGVSVLN